MPSPLAAALAWSCLPALAAGTAAVTRAGPVAEAGPVTRAPAAAVAGPTGGWGWPLDGPPVLLRTFEPPASEWGPGHRGVDLAAQPGTVVRAAGGGVLAWAGSVGGRGVLTVTHAGGLRTTYEPVATDLAVGTAVPAGAAIGRLEDPAGQVGGRPGGHCGGPSCLHWGLLRGSVYLDPTGRLRNRPPVLLPMGR